MENPSFTSILPMLAGGLVVFLYAIRRLSATMKNIFSQQAEKIIARYTGNIFSAIFIGIIVTIILDSSSAVIIIAIVLINAGSLNFRQAMGIIMGANVGTTFSSQIIALNVSKYSVILLLIGFFIWIFGKAAKTKKTGRVILYFGLLFFGLYLLETSVSPLKNSTVFEEWILKMDDPLKGAAAGGLITLIIQSSSATVGMLITLAKQQLIGLSAALSAMLGAELGTCSDTLLAVIGGRYEAIRAGAFHLLFNLIPIIMGLLLFKEFTTLVEWISPNAPIQRQIANAHLLFSLLSVLLFLPFVRPVYRLISWIIPQNKIPVLKNPDHR